MGLGLQVPKIRGAILGVPILRTIAYWLLHRGLRVYGIYHMQTFTLKPEPGILFLTVTMLKEALLRSYHNVFLVAYNCCCKVNGLN